MSLRMHNLRVVAPEESMVDSMLDVVVLEGQSHVQWGSQVLGFGKVVDVVAEGVVDMVHIVGNMVVECLGSVVVGSFGRVRIAGVVVGYFVEYVAVVVVRGSDYGCVHYGHWHGH